MGVKPVESMKGSLFSRLLDLYNRKPLLRGIVRSIPYLGPLLHEWLSGGSENSLTQTYGELQDLCGEIDWQLMKSVGEFVAGPGKEKTDAKAAIQAYRLQLKGALAEKSLTHDELLQWLQQRNSLETLLETFPNPDLRINFSKEHDKITYELRNGESLSIDDPELLWDCTCNERAVIENREGEGTDDPHEQCPVHSDTETAQAVDTAFDDGLVEIIYDGTSVYWKQKPQFWPPSIDAFNMADDLGVEGVYEDGSIKRILDLGCGTGFLGQRIASKNQNINHVAYSDWLLTPIFYSALNWYRQGELSERSNLDLHMGIGVEQTESLKSVRWSSLRQKPFDLVVCNPPYLPLPEPLTDEARTIPLESTVSGTSLLQSIIRHSGDLTNQLYVAFSHIALPEAKKTAGEMGYSLKRVGPERAVPFRVVPALRHRAYVEWLLDERRLEYREGNPHRLWHNVATYTVT